MYPLYNYDRQIIKNLNEIPKKLVWRKRHEPGQYQQSIYQGLSLFGPVNILYLVHLLQLELTPD
jgi:hypothetical protein